MKRGTILINLITHPLPKKRDQTAEQNREHK